MVKIDKVKYFTHIITHNPTELVRLLSIAYAIAKFRYLQRCIGKGTLVEPQTRIINSDNVRIGEGCLLKEGVYIRAGSDGKIVIGDRAAINAFCKIFGHGGVEIGPDTQIGPGSLITTTSHDVYTDLATHYEPVSIGRRVWIGANVTILPGVCIGDYAVIGAGSVVNRDIPPRSVAVGVPARVIKELDHAAEMETFR